jgi:hypothetical protein
MNDQLMKNFHCLKKLFCILLFAALTLPLQAIGIEAPESRPNKKAKNDAQRSGEDLKTIIAMGKEATT